MLKQLRLKLRIAIDFAVPIAFIVAVIAYNLQQPAEELHKPKEYTTDKDLCKDLDRLKEDRAASDTTIEKLQNETDRLKKDKAAKYLEVGKLQNEMGRLKEEIDKLKNDKAAEIEKLQ